MAENEKNKGKSDKKADKRHSEDIAESLDKVGPDVDDLIGSVLVPGAVAGRGKGEKKGETVSGDVKEGISGSKENGAGQDIGEGRPPEKRVKSKDRRIVQSGIAYIKATFNNTMISITDMKGGVIAWSTAGRSGFKGSRKSTAFAATLVGQDVARQAIGRGMRDLEIRIQGAGAGRESAIRALQSAGLSISVIKDITPMPHNGCRRRKRRRV